MLYLSCGLACMKIIMLVRRLGCVSCPMDGFDYAAADRIFARRSTTQSPS